MENDFNPPDTSNGYELSGKIMLSAIVILFAVVVFLIVLHLYARWYLLRARRRQRATRIVFYIDPNSPNPNTTTVTRGLDVSLLNSLPVFSYSPQTHPESLECAVCLSEFQNNEKGRLLPKCQHSFHVDCIDMWFHSHSSCPLCRSPVEPDLPVESPRENRSDVVLYVNETESESEPSSSSGFCATCRHEEESGTTSLADRRKGLDLVGVTIEVPSRRDWENESAASLGFKSPATRLMSLKRILSFNRKTPAASPSSGVGTSSGSGSDSGESTQVQTQTQSRAQTPR